MCNTIREGKLLSSQPSSTQQPKQVTNQKYTSLQSHSTSGHEQPWADDGIVLGELHTWFLAVWEKKNEIITFCLLYTQVQCKVVDGK